MTLLAIPCIITHGISTALLKNNPHNLYSFISINAFPSWINIPTKHGKERGIWHLSSLHHAEYALWRFGLSGSGPLLTENRLSRQPYKQRADLWQRLWVGRCESSAKVLYCTEVTGNHLNHWESKPSESMHTYTWKEMQVWFPTFLASSSTSLKLRNCRTSDFRLCEGLGTGYPSSVSGTEFYIG